MIGFLYVLFGIIIFLSLLVVAAFVIGQKNRPEGQVSSFRTRYTPSVWTPEQMDYTLQVFHTEWSRHYPNTKNKARRSLNKLDIEWVAQRWRQKDSIAAAQILPPTTLKVWRGPRIKNNRYRMNYTALIEGLVQFLAYDLHGAVLDSQTVSSAYRDLIRDVKTKLHGQVSHGDIQLRQLSSKRTKDQ